MNNLKDIFDFCKSIVFDKNLTLAKNWKNEGENRVLVGIVPNYFPREIIHAVNGLAVGLISDETKYPKYSEYSDKDNSTNYNCNLFDGFFQVCQSSTIEDFDGFILPSMCGHLLNDQSLNKSNESIKFIKYINFPQYFQTIIGDILNHNFVLDILREINKINNVEITSTNLNHSIQLFKENLRLTENIYALRMQNKDIISQEDLYYTVLAGLMIPIEKHNEILENIITLFDNSDSRDEKLFKLYSGAYC
ncbi:MAG: hypothetical protein NT007_08265 [Candidatus Kapabacteria bacterium]|nr:hypothetical protein [Candidatus Kapabacteria bacterium]